MSHYSHRFPHLQEASRKAAKAQRKQESNYSAHHRGTEYTEVFQKNCTFILRDLLPPLQGVFSDTRLGRERAQWFIYTLLSVVVPFTSSMTSNLLRTLHTLFGLSPDSQRFYTFMASPTLPWERLWRVLWGLIPAPLTAGRLVVVLDDFINPKVGRKIFGCESIFDHAAKSNQSKYPWA